jgi:hypothetical protein
MRLIRDLGRRKLRSPTPALLSASWPRFRLMANKMNALMAAAKYTPTKRSSPSAPCTPISSRSR